MSIIKRKKITGKKISGPERQRIIAGRLKEN
jgi:hypothetical protein